jgi:hypothetical protein
MTIKNSTKAGKTQKRTPYQSNFANRTVNVVDESKSLFRKREDTIEKSCIISMKDVLANLEEDFNNQE